jgi:F-type H+-transporting ATPase subunit epsilon
VPAKYKLEIITPERIFFEGMVESVIIPSEDGFMSVQKGHEPLVTAIDIGMIKINVDGKWMEASTSEGFMEVRPDETLIFAQAVEWPAEIDVNRAKEAAERAKEKLRQKKSWSEHKQSQISLARAMVRMRVGRKNRNMD